MFNADPRTLVRIARRLERVLIVDPNPAAARMLADLLKEIGGRPPARASATERGLDLIRELDPQLVFVEYAGEALNGPDLTRRLRRSDYPARKVPVVMVTATATLESIKAARDSGVHEFLRKPYTAGDLFRRVENVMLKPRDWIEAQMYVGPDRRRFNSDDYGADRERRGEDDPPAASAEAAA